MSQANLDELLNFCNQVREVLDSPTIAQLSGGESNSCSECLIAMNIDVPVDRNDRGYFMEFVTTKEAEEVATRLSLKRQKYMVYLPQNIDNIAKQFDRIEIFYYKLIDLLDEKFDDPNRLSDSIKSEYEELAYLLPYNVMGHNALRAYERLNALNIIDKEIDLAKEI